MKREYLTTVILVNWESRPTSLSLCEEASSTDTACFDTESFVAAGCTVSRFFLRDRFLDLRPPPAAPVHVAAAAADPADLLVEDVDLVLLLEAGRVTADSPAALLLVAVFAGEADDRLDVDWDNLVPAAGDLVPPADDLEDWVPAADALDTCAWWISCISESKSFTCTS